MFCLTQCSANFFASRHHCHLKRTFVTPSTTGIDESGAFNEYSRNLATPTLRNRRFMCPPKFLFTSNFLIQNLSGFCKISPSISKFSV